MTGSSLPLSLLSSLKATIMRGFGWGHMRDRENISPYTFHNLTEGSTYISLVKRLGVRTDGPIPPYGEYSRLDATTHGGSISDATSVQDRLSPPKGVLPLLPQRSVISREARYLAVWGKGSDSGPNDIL